MNTERTARRGKAWRGMAWQWVERVSIHEAGHAVSFYFDGAEVDAVGLVLEVLSAHI